MRIPRTNNVYGQIVSPDGLVRVKDAVERALGPGSVSLFRAPGADADTLRVRTDVCDFESLALPGGMEYLLNGSVSGTAEHVITFVRSLSAALDDARIEHTFEVLDGRQVVLSLPE